MGYIFTLLYIVAAYLGPETIYGDLADYHLGVIVAVLALLCSLGNIASSGVGKMLQTKALGGLCLIVVISVFINVSKLQAPLILQEFIPVIAGFFLVAMNCRTKGRLQILIACMFFVAVFYIVQAERAIAAGNLESDYLLMQNVSGGQQVIRIRGLDFLGDPNDFAQLMVSLIPCMFFFWRKGKKFTNLLLVYVPAGVLIYGMYLTHSRGGMLALMVTLIVASRRKIGIVPAMVCGGILFLGLSAAGFTGGRDVTDGEDRIDLWSNGLDMIKAHPVFGVGFGQFGEHSDTGFTAHNTYVVCTSELGLVGSWCWLLMLVVTMRNASQGSNDPFGKPKKERVLPEMAVAFGSGAAAGVSAGGLAHLTMPATELALAGGGGFTPPRSFIEEATRQENDAAPSGAPQGFDDDDKSKQVSDDELRRLSGVMLVSMTGFLTAGWFLSRAFAMPLYVLVGMAASVHQLQRGRGIAPPDLIPKQAMKYAAYACLGLLTFVYLNIRADHFLPQ